MTLQEFFLTRSLVDIEYSKITCDHINAKNYVDGKEYPLLFPISLFNLCESLMCEKDTEYYFKGVITKERKWIKDFKNAVIINSERGRGPDKFYYDIEYYSGLNHAKFALCPVGECNWSYRLFEAVMCGCIPIIEECDLFHNVFFHYHKSENHIYLPEKAKENLKILVSNYLL